MSDLLRDYFLNIQQLSTDQIAELRQRMVSILSSNWPVLDTRPNSVAGDLVVTPAAVMQAVAENALFMLMSDMDLSNTANGTTYNPDFVKAFMANLGVLPLSATASTGMVALTFNANKNYVIDVNTQFVYNSNVFQLNESAGNPVVIYAADASNPVAASNNWVLSKVADSTFVVYLPVTGPAGAVVPDGSQFSTSMTQPELVSAVAAGDFDAGSQDETIQQMAQRAQSVFAAANLNTRSGIISFLKQRWPNLLNCYAVLTGDTEMLRGGTTPLGLSDGSVDVLVRSSGQLSASSAVVTLTYDATQGGWTGGLALPATVAFFDLSRGIFQTSTLLNNQSKNRVFSASTHPIADDISIAFSKYEKLGVFIVDTAPANFQPGSVSAITETSGSGARLSVAGEYAGYVFSSNPSRNITLRVLAPLVRNGLNALQCIATDNGTGESGVVYFIPNADVNPSGGMIDKTTASYSQLFNGLDLSIATPGQNFNVQDYIGSTFNFAFQGRTASFTVNYLYEPALIPVDSTIQDPDNRPINIDIVTRSFIPCYVSRFDVSYRIGYGASFDEAGARQDIYDYLTQLSYPDMYDDAQVGQILLKHGASGMTGLNKRSTFFPSLATVFVDTDGNQTSIARLTSTSLLPPSNDLGISVKNSMFILTPGIITFTSTVV
jgi:hypothetical protein